jgi:L-rhamnose mutarotase
MKTYCLALDLKNDQALMAEYKRYHHPGVIWPEVLKSIHASGILSEQIFILGTRMVMVLQTTDNFSFEAKATQDKVNSTIRAWEELMWQFQQPVPGAPPGEKWVLMEKIFET